MSAWSTCRRSRSGGRGGRGERVNFDVRGGEKRKEKPRVGRGTAVRFRESGVGEDHGTVKSASLRGSQPASQTADAVLPGASSHCWKVLSVFAVSVSRDSARRCSRRLPNPDSLQRASCGVHCSGLSPPTTDKMKPRWSVSCALIWCVIATLSQGKKTLCTAAPTVSTWRETKSRVKCIKCRVPN